MHHFPATRLWMSPGDRQRLRLLVLLVALSGGGLSGCAALTNPVAEGVPVRRLSPEWLGASQERKGTLPLSLLEQPPVPVYRLAAGDILGLWIPGVVGEPSLIPPFQPSPNTAVPDVRGLPPALGYPVPVAQDGRVFLPLVDPVSVQGLTIVEAQEAIRKAYVQKEILKPGAVVLATLMRPRVEHVVVMRQESGNITVGPAGQIGGGKRGTGHLVDLPANENDVLHALAITGGLPGLDAYNEVVIYRSCFQNDAERDAILHAVEEHLPVGPSYLAAGCCQTIHIPLWVHPGEKVPLCPEDVVLHSGDVVFLEARDNDLFYTAGLLPPGEHLLPRDHDLDVLEAVAEVGGTLFNGSFLATVNQTGLVLEEGYGNPSPSLLTVLRRTPGGGQIPIRVDLNRAACDPRERIIVLPGDVLILQESPGEALARYFTRTFFNFSLTWEAIHNRFITGTVDISAPDRIPARIGTVVPGRAPTP